MKNLNKIYTSGEVVSLSGASTYTLKQNEVYVNGIILKKENLEVVFNNLCDNASEKDVKVGIRVVLGNLTQPADFLDFNCWLVNDVKPSSLSELVEQLKTALYYDNDNSTASLDITSIENILQNLNKTKATKQKIYNLDSSNSNLVLPKETISNIEVICIGSGSSCSFEVNPTGSNPVNTINLDENSLYKYYRDYSNYTNGVNPEQITINYNGTSGFVIVEIAEV